MAKRVYSVTCAAVGDGGVGKTCLMLTFLTGKYPGESFLPGAMDWHDEFSHVTRSPVKFDYENSSVSLSLVDTVGQDEYQKHREKVCVNVDIFLLCFDVTNPSTLERVEHHWVPEIKNYSIEAPYVLVGTKTDARAAAKTDNTAKHRVVSTQEGMKMADDIGAFAYVECSAQTNSGLRRVFESAAIAYQDKYVTVAMKKKSCVVS